MSICKTELIILDAILETPIEDIQIKGARTFDIKTKFSDTNSPLPNTVPNSGLCDSLP
jgi:thiosulfate/3-mercaptopyruvate sulfurtransferase